MSLKWNAQELGSANRRRVRPKYFVCCWVVLVLGGLVLAIALNVLVDPPGVFPGVHLKSFEPWRYRDNSRAGKAEMARAGKWEVLIMGSSRAKVAFPADHPFLATNRSCNLALDAVLVPEVAAVFDFAQKRNPLKHVILGLDWYMFSSGGSFSPEFNQTRFSPKFKPIEYYCKQLLGQPATLQSFQSIRQKLRQYQPPAQDTRGFFQPQLGPKTCQRDLFSRLLHLTTYWDQNTDLERVEFFRHIVQACREQQIELKVVLMPVHALDTEMVYAGGRWPQFEAWKTKLVNVLAEEGVEGKVGLWDFTGYAGPPSESIPPWGDTTQRMKYYYESSHCTPECGRLVLDTILGESPSNSFGIKLTRHNLKAHLAEILAARADYARTNAAEVQWVQEIVAEAKKGAQARLAAAENSLARKGLKP